MRLETGVFRFWSLYSCYLNFVFEPIETTLAVQEKWTGTQFSLLSEVCYNQYRTCAFCIVPFATIWALQGDQALTHQAVHGITVPRKKEDLYFNHPQQEKATRPRSHLSLLSVRSARLFLWLLCSAPDSSLPSCAQSSSDCRRPSQDWGSRCPSDFSLNCSGVEAAL